MPFSPATRRAVRQWQINRYILAIGMPMGVPGFGPGPGYYPPPPRRGFLGGCFRLYDGPQGYYRPRGYYPGGY